MMVGICCAGFLTDKLPKCRCSELSQTVKAIPPIANILEGVPVQILVGVLLSVHE